MSDFVDKVARIVHDARYPEQASNAEPGSPFSPHVEARDMRYAGEIIRAFAPTEAMVLAALEALNAARVGTRGPIPRQAMEKALAAAEKAR